MLGSPIRSLTEIHTRLGDKPFAAEFKYDGQRAQIHAFQETPQKVVVKLFSRHLEDMTDKVSCILWQRSCSHVQSSIQTSLFS